MQTEKGYQPTNEEGEIKKGEGMSEEEKVRDERNKELRDKLFRKELNVGSVLVDPDDYFPEVLPARETAQKAIEEIDTFFTAKMKSARSDIERDNIRYGWVKNEENIKNLKSQLSNAERKALHEWNDVTKTELYSSIVALVDASEEKIKVFVELLENKENVSVDEESG